MLYSVLVVNLFICKCVSRSVVPDSAMPWTAAHPAPLSMRFSRQGYWNGLPFPSPGHLPSPGVEFGSPALQADSLLTELRGKPILYVVVCICQPQSPNQMFSMPWNILLIVALLICHTVALSLYL